MRPILILAALALGGCAGGQPVPIPADQIASIRAQAGPRAEANCRTMGFSETTAPTLDFCTEAGIGAAMEGRFHWTRIQASGQNHIGTEQMAGISRCIMQGITPQDPRMAPCVAAATQLAIQEHDQRVRDQQARVAAAAASRPVIVNPAPIFTPAPSVAPFTCTRFGNTTNCF